MVHFKVLFTICSVCGNGLMGYNVYKFRKVMKQSCSWLGLKFEFFQLYPLQKILER